MAPSLADSAAKFPLDTSEGEVHVYPNDLVALMMYSTKAASMMDVESLKCVEEALKTLLPYLELQADIASFGKSAEEIERDVAKADAAVTARPAEKRRAGCRGACDFAEDRE